MKIVIAGGGTAGWLSAFIFTMSNPNKHDIVVIESSKIGIIGTGEASSGSILDILSGYKFNRKEIDLLDFVDKTDATPKYALNHINWSKSKGSYFAPIDGSVSARNTPDFMFNYVISEYGTEKAYLASQIGQAYSKNKLPIGKDIGMQFDGFKVGKYIKDYLVKYHGVNCVDSTIEDIKIKSNGIIESLTLEDGTSIEGDLFVDCTGMKRILANKLEIKWKSYKEYLPLDRAMPFLLDYGKDKKIQPMTEAEALSSGWMWRIPLLTRKGCGYVYSSEFISEDEAQMEAEKIVGKAIKPIKNIKFDSGRLEEVWKGNCLITGLASSFLEPLEATSIHATITQVYNFCIEHLTDKIETTATKHNIKVYNENTIKMYDNLLDFVSLHYQGGRDDSEFWRFIKNEKIVTPRVLDYIERAKYKIPSDLHFPSNTWGGADDLWKWSLAGLDLIDKETAKNELLYSDTYDHARTNYRIFEENYQEELKYQPRLFEFDVTKSISSQFKEY